jgi:proteic killer suppression protein
LDVIRSFRSKPLRRFAEKGDASKLAVQNTDRIRRILVLLDAAMTPEDMNLPGLGFHGLKGQDKGRYAVDASGNWRVTFGWLDGDAIDVDLEDYH